MIVKSISKKSVCFGKLLSYIGVPERIENREDGSLWHNFRASHPGLADLELEFLDNYRFQRTRQNGVTCFHEILSLAEGSEQVENLIPILTDLGHAYLQYRAPRALAYGRIHTDTDHAHLHLIISGNELESSKKVRISRKQFETIKRKLERYQERHYPLLSRSMVFGATKSKKGLTPAQITVRDQVLRHLERAGTETAFAQHLEQAGMKLYQRGKSLGVQVVGTGKKYRLKTLDLMKAFYTRKAQWSKIRANMPELTGIQKEVAQYLRQDRRRGYETPTR